MPIAQDAATARSQDAQAEALRESEARFRNTFENAAVGMAHVAPDGRWLRVNRRVSEIVGYRPEELLKITFQDITHPDDLDIDLSLLEETIRGKRDTYRIEKRYWHKEGHIVWVNLTVGCVRKASGEVDYFISVLEDISEQKRMHEALAASEARFRAVQQTTPDGFFIFRSLRDDAGRIEDFRIEFANPTAIRMFQRPEAQLVGSTLRNVLPAIMEAGIFELYVQVVETGEPWQGEYRYPGLNGEEWYRVAAARLDDGFAVSFASVTDRKRAEAHREMLMKELSHRVKNTLATVQTMASHTLREATDLDTFRDAFVGRLMAISKSHDLLVDPRHSEADLYQLVHDQVMPYARSGSAQVRLSGPPLRLGAEASHAFGLVLHELATNAAKYGALSTEDGWLEISWSEPAGGDVPEVIVEWREHGGPPVSPPARHGFGSILIGQSLTYGLGGSAEIDYLPEGVHARFRFPRRDRT